jgi:amino acid transporter
LSIKRRRSGLAAPCHNRNPDVTDDEGTDTAPETPSLEKRVTRPGRHVGDRYVRIVRPVDSGLRGHDGRYVATEEALLPSGRFARKLERWRRFLMGQPLDVGAEGEQQVTPLTGLAVLAPSNVSSSAYATEEILRALAIAGVAALALAPPVALALVAVLGLVVLSESRVMRTYPSGGGSYQVARAELGVVPALVAASALLVDYILTVAVSVAAGVVAVLSAFPELSIYRLPVAVGLIALVALSHIRGVREAGALFAFPTYAYLGGMLALIAVGVVRVVLGDFPLAPPSPPLGPATDALMVLIIVRAFAGGAAALTGSEAVANVVPSFRPPQTRNAILTLLLMTSWLAAIFLGLTYLATVLGIVPDPAEIESVNSMVARAIFGAGPAHIALQFVTAIFLLVAANTGFAGFPRLAAVLANDRFMPRHFADQGARLSHSFGIFALAVVAAVVLVMFDASVTALVPLYTVAVFLAFFVSQSGMLRHSTRDREGRWWTWAVVHGAGAVIFGGLVVAIVLTRFSQAWVALVLIPLLALMLYSIHRHYRSVEDALVVPGDVRVPRVRPPVVVVPVARIDRAALQALAFARSISDTVKAVHVSTTRESGDEFRRRWQRTAPDISLDVVESPYRSLVPPLLRYIDALDKSDDRPITVVISEFVPRRWWEWVLHSQTAFRLKAALLFRPNTIVIDVPYHHRDTADLADRPGDTES